jgi:rhodanese-related sulfurtransferase
VVGSVSPEELAHELQTDGTAEKLLLLDVREDDERALARIEPSVHIPMGMVPGRLSELPRDRRIVVYCHSGFRSYTVAAYLEHEGFAGVRNLTGGIDAWSEQVDSQVPRY